MKIAIIGSGISGLSSAYLLNSKYDITLFEKEPKIGGHSRSIQVNDGHKNILIDTGFIVFNYKNYPHLTALFKHLNVSIAPSSMSFGVSHDLGKFEYGTYNLNSLFAQRSHIANPKFYQFIGEILRFHKIALEFLENPQDISLGEFCEFHSLSDFFIQHYLMAMGASIWSTPALKMMHFPAMSFLIFFKNHGLLDTKGQHQWYTVKGSSQHYVDTLSQFFADKIQVNSSIEKVTRTHEGVQLSINQHNQIRQETFDQVVFATHSDQVLKMLSNPTTLERKTLGDILYQNNTVALHTDSQWMPKRKAAWSSWVYLSQANQVPDQVSLTYWMNNLQPLDTQKNYFVTLNPNRSIDPKHLIDLCTLSHPVFDKKALTAQKQIAHFQGQDKLWFTGAWLGYGFHEDGLRSAVEISQKLNIDIPW